MLLILTYHRIVEQGTSIRDFFDVSAHELAAHLGLVKNTWGKGLSPEALQREQSRGRRERAGFLVTFDDGTTDHYFAAAPVLERYGLRGVFFVSTSLLETAGYLTLRQCQELQARGHAIESHAHEHKALVGLPAEELARQLSESRRRLREAGLGRWDWLAAPGGYFDAAVLQAASGAGYRAVRTLEWGYNRTLNPFRVESICINRRTAGRWFGPLVSPHCEAVKKAFYRAKEALKRRVPALYAGLRTGR